MRVANFSIGEGADAAECYVTSLAGDGGGVLANLDRWRAQMGAQPLSSAELAELARVTICGVESPVLEMSGDFAGMGGEVQTGSGLLGAVAPLADRALFVKLVGPAATVAEQRETFLVFCESLTLGPDPDHAEHDHAGHDHAETDHD